jgi:DNA-binding transcriptional MerR regulator
MAEYKIKDLETLTGIKAHTIRIWEKRYGLLSPDRTDTQIRTYNDEELQALLNVALLNKHGVKISRIAEMSREEIKQKVWEVKNKYITDSSTELLILALIEMDELLFKSTLDQLIDEIGLESTFTDKLIPFLDRIGVMWLVGSISTAQEHFISNLIRQKVISTTDKLPIPESFENPILLFLPEHEWHEISLLFYHFILRNEGKATVYLGQSLPYDALLESIEKIKPRVLVTSWLTAVDEKFITNFFKTLQKDTGDLPVLAGGIQIKNYSKSLGGLIREIHGIDVLKDGTKAE